MNWRAVANQSIPWLYGLSATLLFVVFVRLWFDFSPRIDITPETAPSVRAPFLSIPNIGPIAREAWMKKTLRECFSFTSQEMTVQLDKCAADYFDVSSQNAFLEAMPKTQFARYMIANPNNPSEVQGINTRGPFLIYQGGRNGLPVWRYQTEVMTSLFLESQIRTRRWLIDATMTFDEPDALFFSGFRYLSFYIKERT